MLISKPARGIRSTAYGWAYALSYLCTGCAMLVAGCGKPPVDPATQEYLRGVEAIASGDHAAGLEALNRSLAASPTAYAYLERAKLHVAMQQETLAIQDCEAGLRLEPEHHDLKWYLSQLKKPASSRFRGAEAQPPSATK